jgi:Flp pilus assembly pilin Flp
MQKLKQWMRSLRMNTNGQDLIEYAFMAAFVAFPSGTVMPSVATSVTTLFSDIASIMIVASLQDS